MEKPLKFFIDVLVSNGTFIDRDSERNSNRLLRALSSSFWMVSNHAVWGWKAPVKASVSGVSLLQLSPFFASIFPLFPQKRLILRL